MEYSVSRINTNREKKITSLLFIYRKGLTSNRLRFPFFFFFFFWSILQIIKQTRVMS